MKLVRFMKCLIHGLLCTIAFFGSQALAMTPEGLHTDIDKHERDIQYLASFAREVLGDETHNPDPQLVEALNYRKEPIDAQIKATLANIKIAPLEQRVANIHALRCQGLLRRLKELRFRNFEIKNRAPKQNTEPKNEAKKEKEKQTKPTVGQQKQAVAKCNGERRLIMGARTLLNTLPIELLEELARYLAKNDPRIAAYCWQFADRVNLQGNPGPCDHMFNLNGNIFLTFSSGTCKVWDARAGGNITMLQDVRHHHPALTIPGAQQAMVLKWLYSAQPTQ